MNGGILKLEMENIPIKTGVPIRMVLGEITMLNPS